MKYNNNVDRETARTILSGILSYITDIRLIISEKYDSQDFFAALLAPFHFYTYLISVMVFVLSFFMIAVSYSQKMRDLSWE